MSFYLVEERAGDSNDCCITDHIIEAIDKRQALDYLEAYYVSEITSTYGIDRDLVMIDSDWEDDLTISYDDPNFDESEYEEEDLEWLEVNTRYHDFQIVSVHETLEDAECAHASYHYGLLGRQPDEVDLIIGKEES